MMCRICGVRFMCVVGCRWLCVLLIVLCLVKGCMCVISVVLMWCVCGSS